jgi:hypothetical protein
MNRDRDRKPTPASREVTITDKHAPRPTPTAPHPEVVQEMLDDGVIHEPEDVRAEVPAEPQDVLQLTPAQEPEPTPQPTEPPFPDVRTGDFVRVGAFPGIVTAVNSDNPLAIRITCVCWNGLAVEWFGALAWSGSGEAPCWDWVARIGD